MFVCIHLHTHTDRLTDIDIDIDRDTDVDIDRDTDTCMNVYMCNACNKCIEFVCVCVCVCVCVFKPAMPMAAKASTVCLNEVAALYET